MWLHCIFLMFRQRRVVKHQINPPVCSCHLVWLLLEGCLSVSVYFSSGWFLRCITTPLSKAGMHTPESLVNLEIFQSPEGKTDSIFLVPSAQTWQHMHTFILTFQLSNNHICLQLRLWVPVMCFLSWQWGEKKWKMCVANALCFFWDVSSEFSPQFSRTDLDWIHSLSSHTCLMTLELIILHFLLLSHPSPLGRPTLHPSVCKPSALTALRRRASSYVAPFFSLWSLLLNLWPPCSLRVKRSDIK